MKIIFKLYSILFIGFALSQSYAITTEEKQSALEVINRVVPELKARPEVLRLESLDKQNDCDVFETSVKDGVLTVKGSSGIALCRGLYDYLKTNHFGMLGWNNKWIHLPKWLPDADVRRVESPVQHHYYFNVVTYGYTMPYWTWERWQEEIDWMAMHGIDLPLALAGTEAIASRVWKKMGLTQEEIDEFYTGPAHLPWQRMGNVVNHDGSLSDSWHKDQIAMQHKVLQRMKSLGMKPVCPAFAGFVPKGLQRVFPNVKLLRLGWGGWPVKYAAHLLAPTEPLFREIGKQFMEEWQKEFGKNKYHLADSFNEMDLPVDMNNPVKRDEMLSRLGDEVYQSISAANPGAIWVMQGWMFGYQRNIWNADTLKALLSKVPDDQMLLLDLATDYNKAVWCNGMNWDVFKGFFNKPWVYSFVPNMGGKSAMTGKLDFYANGHVDMLKSTTKGRLAGMGMAPEGIENNDVLYEMITDAGWRSEEVDVTQWLKDYSKSRYGDSPETLNQAWELFRKTAYSNLNPHPRFNWQLGPGSRGNSVNDSEDFLKGLALFVNTKGLENSSLFRQDIIEMTVHYLGIRMSEASVAALTALDEADFTRASECMKYFRKYALQADTLLECHPTWRLERWIDFARSHGESKMEQDRYEENARRLVTIWGPPVDDYSARIWSGLIRDYYLPRWEHYINARIKSEDPKMSEWEEAWVASKGTSQVKCPENVVQACRDAVNQATPLPASLAKSCDGVVLGNWSESDVSPEWKELTWAVEPATLAGLRAIRFKHTSGNHALEISQVEIVADGKVVSQDIHMGKAGNPNSANSYQLTPPRKDQGNNGCQIRAKVRSLGGTNSNGKVELFLKK